MNDPYQQPGASGYQHQGAGGYQQPGSGAGDQQKFGGYAYPGMPPQQPPQVGFVPLVQPQPMPGPNAYSNVYPGGFVDPENPLGPEVKGFDFTEQSVRKGFIRKVYAILSCQLFVTLLFIATLNMNNNVRIWMRSNLALLIVAFIVAFAVLIAMACVESLRRKTPLNYIMLSIFTLAESYVVACSTARFNPADVLLAVIVTTVVCVGLTIFAFQTKWDFTVMGGMLFVCLLLLMLFGIIAMFFPGRIVMLVYSSMGAILFSFYLIYDTQMMMGGTHKHSISPEEYVFAAITLYLDVINIFLYILSIIGSKN